MNLNIDNYLRIDLTDMTLTLISVVIIVWIAKKYFWNNVKEYLEKREAFIQGQLDEAVSKNQEGQLAMTTAQEELASLRAQSKDILDNAQTTARSEANAIIAEAKENAISIKQKAHHDIEQERREVTKQIKQEMSDIALLAASKVVEKELNDEIHRKYIEDFIDEAGDAKWQA